MLANPQNWRIHPGPQQDLIRESLEGLGWVRSILVNIHSGCIVDGHQRVLEADKAGQATVPVDYVDLTPEEEAQALALLDAIPAMAVADPQKVAELAEAVAADRQRAGKPGYADGLALDEFFEQLRNARSASTPLLRSEGNSVYEKDATRQIVLHLAADDYTWTLSLLGWAREHIGVDTNTEAIVQMLRIAWEAEGSPALGGQASRGRDRD